jgi:hypothetical protein
MDERLGLRIAFEGHRSGATPAAAAADAGWGSLVVTPPHDAADVASGSLTELRRLAGTGVAIVWDGRGTGSWVDVGRPRLRALDRARDQVRHAAGAGATAVVVGCSGGAPDQPADARWDQIAAGLAELAYEAEVEGVRLVLDARTDEALVDLDVPRRLLQGEGVAAGVLLGLDHSSSPVGEEVPQPWWPAVAWLRLHTPPPSAWPGAVDDAVRYGREAAATFPGAVVEVAIWGWEHTELAQRQGITA